MTHGSRLPRLGLAALLGVALAACGQQVTGTSNTTAKDALYFVQSATGLPPLYLNEAYVAPITVAGGVGPYSVRVVSGTLPPGLTVNAQGLSGTPTKSGTFKFTLEATDSTLSVKASEYTVNVQDLPPTSLTVTLPAGEVRGETRIPVVISAPRRVRAARLVWELPPNVQVTRVQPVEQGGVLFWRQDGQTVTVDVGFKVVPRGGARIALIGVKPARAVTLTAARLAYEARDGDGKLLNEQKLPVPVTPVSPAPAPSGTAPDPTKAPAPADSTPGGSK